MSKKKPAAAKVPPPPTLESATRSPELLPGGEGAMGADEIAREQEAMGIVEDTNALAKEGLAEQLAAEAPAPVLMPIPAKKVHATQLFPHLRYAKAPNGQRIPLPRRTGGQYAVRRLVLINTFNGEERVDWMTPGILPQQWGVQEYERFSDPTKHKEDLKYGNLEVIFDFQDQLLAFWKSQGRKAPVWDPLHKNDWDSTKFPPGMQLPPPPGGVPHDAG